MRVTAGPEQYPQPGELALAGGDSLLAELFEAARNTSWKPLGRSIVRETALVSSPCCRGSEDIEGRPRANGGKFT